MDSKFCLTDITDFNEIYMKHIICSQLQGSFLFQVHGKWKTDRRYIHEPHNLILYHSIHSLLCKISKYNASLCVKLTINYCHDEKLLISLTCFRIITTSTNHWLWIGFSYGSTYTISIVILEEQYDRNCTYHDHLKHLSLPFHTSNKWSN